MGNDGQMILLSALVACLCLFGVVACVAAVDGVPDDGSGHLSCRMDNVVWARDCALQKAAFYNSAYPWDCHEEAALRFKREVNSSMDSLGSKLLKHGEVYGFTFNGTLAGEYLAAHPGNGTLNVDGVLVERSGGSTRICGCAFDVLIYDGDATYSASQVATFY